MPETDEAEQPQQDVCVYCKGAIYFGVVIQGEWSHGHGDRYCHTPNGFTATPLREARPTYHGDKDVL